MVRISTGRKDASVRAPPEQDETTYQLISQKQHRLEREPPAAKVEKVLQTRSQEVDDHGIVLALHSEPPHEGHAHTTGQGLVHLGLIFQLRVLGLDRFELDGYLLAGDDVHAEVDVPCIFRGWERG